MRVRLKVVARIVVFCSAINSCGNGAATAVPNLVKIVSDNVRVTYTALRRVFNRGRRCGGTSRGEGPEEALAMSRIFIFLVVAMFGLSPAMT